MTVDDITLTPRLRRWLASKYNLAFDGDADHFDDIVLRYRIRHALESRDLTEETLGNLQKTTEGTVMSATKTANPDKVFSGGSRIEVKDESSRYSTKRFEARHPKLGDVFSHTTRQQATLPSELDDAKAGALIKHIASRSGLMNVDMPDHEKALLDEMAECDDWVGKVGGVEYDKITGGSGVKALLDDTTSGGLEIAPIAFDSNIITFPLLTGEVFPRVQTQDVPRGRRIEGGSISAPTVTWGQGDNVEVGLFDTTSLVAEINTTIHGVAVAVEIGRDFLSDAAVAVGSILTRLIGERLSEELDDVIANGNGTNRPQGIGNASGLATVNADNGAGGPWTLNDYTSLMFASGKQYRRLPCAFLSNDTVYQRSRSIRIDPQVATVDQRPVLSDVNSFNNYMSLGWAHAIQNDIGDRTCIFGAMSKYRLYRRAGLDIRFEQGGKELARKNLVLLIARARFGGRVMDANAFATITDGQT